MKPVKGIESWIETHFEVVAFIAEATMNENDINLCNVIYNEQGRGGLYELAEDWTDEFEAIESDDIDTEYFERIEEFLIKKNVLG